MKRYLIVPVVASLLLGGVALTQTAISAEDGGNPPPPVADGMGPDWHHHPHMGMFHREDPLAKLQKPLTADAVKQALTDWFAKRPEVKSVTDKDATTLVVEITDPNGKTHKFEVNKATGERRRAW
jgi:hypothetical protein